MMHSVSYTITPLLVRQYHPEWTLTQAEAWLDANSVYLEDGLAYRAFQLCKHTSGPWHKLGEVPT